MSDQFCIAFPRKKMKITINIKSLFLVFWKATYVVFCSLVTAKLSNTFPCFGLTGIKAEPCPGCCGMKRLRKAFQPGSFHPKTQTENQLLGQSSQALALRRGDLWAGGISPASSSDGCAAPEPHQMEMTPPGCAELSKPGRALGAAPGRVGALLASPCCQLQCAVVHVGNCLSAKNIWGQQLPFSLLDMIQPYEFHFMQSKDKLYTQIKHSSYFMFLSSGKIREPTWWNLHCLKIQGLFTKNTFCWWQSSTP